MQNICFSTWRRSLKPHFFHSVCQQVAPGVDHEVQLQLYLFLNLEEKFKTTFCPFVLIRKRQEQIAKCTCNFYKRFKTFLSPFTLLFVNRKRQEQIARCNRNLEEKWAPEINGSGSNLLDTISGKSGLLMPANAIPTNQLMQAQQQQQIQQQQQQKQQQQMPPDAKMIETMIDPMMKKANEDMVAL